MDVGPRRLAGAGADLARHLPASIGKPQTYFTFEDTLTQIGLGYFFLFLLGLVRPRWLWWVAVAVLLVGYWAAFALYPLPGPEFDYQAVGVSADWAANNFSGFAAHWNKNTNFAWAFDRWFLNLFPREKPFLFNGGGYATLSFIPTLATMILGLIAGGWLREERTHAGQARTAGRRRGGVPGGRAGGRLLRRLPHRQAHLDAVVDALQRRLVLPAAGLLLRRSRRDRPLPLLGLPAPRHRHELDRRLLHGPPHPRIHPVVVQDPFGTGYFPHVWWAPEPITAGAACLAVQWLILFWMYRRGIFVRI